MSCWCLPERICGRDTDELFAYPTVRYTLVRDRRLGLLRIGFIVAIFIFIIVVQICYMGSHLVETQPEGTVQFTLMQPMNRCNTTARESGSADCGPCYYGGFPTAGTHDGWYSPDCYNDLPRVTALPYCAQSPAKQPGKKLNCSVESFLEAQTVFESSLLITTRVTNSTQRRVCDTLDPAHTYCDRTWTLPTEGEIKYYIAGIEGYTIMFDHSMQARKFGIRTYSTAMKSDGLRMPAGHATADYWCRTQGDRDSAPCMIRGNITSEHATSGAGSDFFRIDVILAAAGVALDDISHGGGSYRYTGITVVITVDYKNRNSWAFTPGHDEYTYSADVFPHTNFKLNEVVPRGTDERVIVDRHGIRVVFLHSGVLHAFEFNSLLIQLTASLTLFAVSSLLVDFLCTNLLPYHRVYSSYKYVRTVDFSDLRDSVAVAMREKGVTRKQALLKFSRMIDNKFDPFSEALADDQREDTSEARRPTGWFVDTPPARPVAANVVPSEANGKHTQVARPTSPASDHEV
eukprot:TRINITY_DN71410_c0_g1_i1.p1 TRINITY_DN71410_c0_g1~~TRINITY_DN71410_c0_g1_i1.p1  ORF type:complete len:547 (+),score=164.08 TRINITY_DN71410_c0_g1_i1:91-1641(+)